MEFRHKKRIAGTARSASRSIGKETSPEKHSLPNSMVMRMMQDEAAEQEADRLSQGVSSSTQDALREEMGGRLGADFSSVRFHSDSVSADRGQSMGARAWAQGSDIYFGRGGFNPSVAAHELVHTVQQGAVRGNVSQSMPLGTVQMLPEKDEDEANENLRRKQNRSNPAVIQQAILESFGSRYGAKVYKDIERDLKDMIKKGAGNQIPAYTQALGIRFIVEGAEQNYSLKEILAEIAEKPIKTREDAIDRSREYHSMINALTKKLGNYGLEALAISTNLLNRPPKFSHPDNQLRVSNSKRAYQVSEDQMTADKFNPYQDPKLARVQAAIDHAANHKEAYAIFARFSGNRGGKYNEEEKTPNADLKLFKNKLKHMTRVIRDYPELWGYIGDMDAKPQNGASAMASGSTFGGLRKAPISYNPSIDKAGMEAEIYRGKVARDIKYRNALTGDLDHAGTHELSHVLASLMVDTKGKTVTEIQQKSKRHDFENDIISQVLTTKGILTEEERNDPENGLKYYQEDGIHDIGRNFTSSHYKDQLNTLDSKVIEEKSLTSNYGRTDKAEFFAEAFHDVYTHGAKARKTSVEIVKEYERRQTDRQRKEIMNKPKRGLFRRILDWFKF